MTVVTFFIRPIGHDVGCTQSLVKNGTPAAFQKLICPHRLFSIVVEDAESTIPAKEVPAFADSKTYDVGTR